MQTTEQTIKPLARWASELGVNPKTLRRWLVEDCDLGFTETRKLVERAYIDVVRQKRIARPRNPRERR